MNEKEAREYLFNWQNELINGGMPFCSDRVQALRMAIEALSSTGKPRMTKEVREALTGLVMCAREECEMCKYENKCGFSLQCELATENMHTIMNAFESADRPGVAYICDRRACKGNCSDCFRTTDIEHAKHFERLGDMYMESAERPTGEWIADTKYYEAFNETLTSYKCSVCGHEPYHGKHIEQLHFCSNCGAQMRNKQGEQQSHE